MLKVRRIEANEGQILKTLRCEALREAPYAFTTTLEDAQQKPDEEWNSTANTLAGATNSASFLAFYDGNPCGMMGCYLEKDAAEILNLVAVWVSPKYRRMKVGHALLEGIGSWAKEKGAQVVHAWVAEQNEGALSFYRSMGFTQTSEHAPFRPGDTQKMILLAFPL